MLCDQELIGIGAAFVVHGHRFPTPDQTCSCLSEAFPAPDREFCGISVGGSVPALHRLHGYPIANPQTTTRQSLSQRRLFAGDNLAITRNNASEGSNVPLEVIDVLQARHAHDRLCDHARTPRLGNPSTANAPRSAKTIKTV